LLSFTTGLEQSINSQLAFISGLVTVVDEGTTYDTFQTGEIDESFLDDIRNLNGIKRAAPVIFGTIPGIGSLGGVDPQYYDMFSGDIDLDEGREFEIGEGELNAGFLYAKKHKVGLGDVVEIRGINYEIVGINKETGSSEDDNGLSTDFETAQDIVGKEIITAIFIEPTNVEDVEKLAAEINDQFGDDVDALTEKDAQRSASDFVGQLNTLIYVVGGIASIIATVVIMNVMFMSVRERTREIGTMKAIGATDNQILLEIIGEGLFISGLGGIIGVILSVIAAALLNIVLNSNLAVVSFRLSAEAILFALFIGVIGSYFPAKQAAKLNPIVALRYE